MFLYIQWNFSKEDSINFELWGHCVCVWVYMGVGVAMAWVIKYDIVHMQVHDKQLM